MHQPIPTFNKTIELLTIQHIFPPDLGEGIVAPFQNAGDSNVGLG